MRNKACYAILAGTVALLFLASAAPLSAQISEKNLRFVEYPGFPTAHSTWNSIGYSKKHNKVYIGVTDHRGKVGLYEYDVALDRMRLRGFLHELTNLREYQWQGKIHSQIIEGPDGNMYFSSDGGESREEFLMNHPHGYSGGFFFRWEPELERLRIIGRGMQYESIKDLAVDRIDGTIMGVSYPQVHLLLYDYRKNDLRDMGRVGSDHVPRVLWRDWWGNMYYVDWRQRMIKYEHDTGELLFCSDSLPAFDGTPGGKIITGVTGWAEDRENGVIYLVTYGAMLAAFYPSQTGFGRVEDLGGVFDSDDREPYNYYCPNLALGDNGLLYYFLGGHGSLVEGKEQNVLMEFDPRTREKRIVLRFPQKVINEVTGSRVKDANGNMYFCGRRHDPQAEMMGESGASRPFMIILNPEIPLQ